MFLLAKDAMIHKLKSLEHGCQTIITDDDASGDGDCADVGDAVHGEIGNGNSDGDVDSADEN